MTRIQAECYIEVWRLQDIYSVEKPCSIKCLEILKSTIAIFLIKPQSTTLAERLEARKVNNNLNQ
jgi:hypothetical protein